MRELLKEFAEENLLAEDLLLYVTSVSRGHVEALTYWTWVTAVTPEGVERSILLTKKESLRLSKEMSEQGRYCVSYVTPL
jgi:hypothetical protein